MEVRMAQHGRKYVHVLMMKELHTRVTYQCFIRANNIYIQTPVEHLWASQVITQMQNNNSKWQVHFYLHSRPFLAVQKKCIIIYSRRNHQRITEVIASDSRILQFSFFLLILNNKILGTTSACFRVNTDKRCCSPRYRKHPSPETYAPNIWARNGVKYVLPLSKKKIKILPNFKI